MDKTPRVCIQCAETQPWEMFVRRKSVKTHPRGWSTERKCRNCRRKRDRDYNRAKWASAPTPMSPEAKAYRSRWHWVRHRIPYIKRMAIEPVIIFVMPTTDIRDNQIDSCVRGMTITARKCGSKLPVPVNAIPVATVHDKIVMPHSSCPRRWLWFADMLETRLKNQQKTS